MVNTILNKKITRKEFIKNVGIISALMLIIPNFVSSASGKIRYFDGIVSHNGNVLKNVGTPSISDDGANKGYVDGRTLTISEVTGTSQNASVWYSYITNNPSLVTVTLPSTSSVGDIIKVSGKGAGGWKIAQNASQLIKFNNTTTTTGTSGYIESTYFNNSVELLCVTANTDWLVISSVGNINLE